MHGDKSIISEAGGSGNSVPGEPATAISATPTPTRDDLVRPIQQTRAAASLHPCEERTDGKLCRKESDSMTALGKLLCKEHREAYEAKWGIKVNRLQLMAP